MKFQIEVLVFVLLSVLRSGLADDPLDIIRAKCRAVFDLNEDEVAQGAVTPKPQLGCYLECVLQALDVISDEGIISPDDLLMKIGHEIGEEAKPILSTCVEEPKDIDDSCQTVFKYMECVRQKSLDIFSKLGLYTRPEDRH